MQSKPTRFVALLNRLWDAKLFTTQRKTSDNCVLKNRRPTLNLLSQPILMQQLLGQSQHIARQSGFLPRCLLADPKSLMGTRLYQEPMTLILFYRLSRADYFLSFSIGRVGDQRMH